MKRFFVAIAILAGVIFLMGACASNNVSASSADNRSYNSTAGNLNEFNVAVARYSNATNPNEKLEALIAATKAAPSYETIDEFLRSGPVPYPEKLQLRKNARWLAEYIEIPVRKFSEFIPAKIALHENGFPPQLTDRLAERMKLMIIASDLPSFGYGINPTTNVGCVSWQQTRDLARSPKFKEELNAQYNNCAENNAKLQKFPR